MVKKVIRVLSGLLLAVVVLAGCGLKSADSNPVETVKIGVVSGPAVDIWKNVAKRLEKDKIKLELVEFTDYNTPNDALQNGELDLNAFQHVAFLEDYNKNNNGSLEAVGFTMLSPFGFYADKLSDAKGLPEGATVAIPNDVTNGGRALLLLQALGYIELKEEKAGQFPTVNSIQKNPKNLTIKELDAAQLPRTLSDVDAACINTNFAVDAGLSPHEDALYLDTQDKANIWEAYKNVIAANPKLAGYDQRKALYEKVVKAYQTKETAEDIASYSNQTDVPAWD